MAKKKVTHQQKPSQEDLPQHNQEQTHHTTAMDDPSEKLQSLKSLNSLLIKETRERRQQVDTLVKSKEALESELTRSIMERNVLGAELARLSDESVGLELEKSVAGVFVCTQMGEMGVRVNGLMRQKVEVEKRLKRLEREIEKVKSEKAAEIGLLKKKVDELMRDIENEREVLSHATHERDGMKYELAVQIKEANGLREKVVEMEERERRIEGEVRKLKIEYERMIKEKKESESKLEILMREKDVVKKNLGESVKAVENFKREIGEIMREKEGIEKERSCQIVKINELEKEVSELNESVTILQDEEKRLLSEVFELKNRNAEAVEQQEKMLIEFEALLKENREKEMNIGILLEEKALVMESLENASKELDDNKQKMEEVIQEKSDIEELKAKRETEISQLQKEMGELKDVVSTLQESCKDQVEENKRLHSEVSQYKEEINLVTVERAKVQKGFDEEKKNGLNLRLKVSEMENSVEEAMKEMEQMRSKQENLTEENRVVETQFELLMEEKDSLQKSLVKAQQDTDDMRATMESMHTNLEQALLMLKNTAALVCMSKDESNGKEHVFTNEQKIEEVLHPYAAELEAIKNAFRNREMKAEDMKRQLEFLQNSVAEAHKKRSFWALLSSATTIFAAASVAYVTRGH